MTLVDADAGFHAKPRRPLAGIIATEGRRKRRRRIVSWSFVAMIPLVGLLAWTALRPRPAPFSARFRTVPVVRGDLVREVRATGHLEAVTTVQVGAEVSGRIASVEVDFNDHVRAGQVLARFDRAALQAQLAQMQATLAATRAAVEQAKVDRERTAADFARADRLHAQKTVSDADYDTARAAMRVAEQRVTAASAQVAAQDAAHALAKTNLDHTVIRAPIDGVVITRNVDPGQTVAAMLQTPVLFTVAADLRRMRVVAAVDEGDIGEVAREQRAAFTVNAYPERRFEGTVTEVRNSPVVLQDVVTYAAVVEVDNTDLALKPGMTASVRVRTASADDVLGVPNAALHFAPPGKTTAPEPGVWLLDGADLRRVPVKIGVSDGERTEISSGGLAVGQSVLVELTPEGRKAYGVKR